MKFNPSHRLHSCASFPFVELRHSFPSEIQAISPFADQLMGFIARFQNADKSESDIELALREALANAIVHGNREDPQKRVFVICRCWTNGAVLVTVRDEGQGFEIETVPNPTVPEDRLRTTGRGIYLMQTLMDEVRFERGGTVVHMHKNASTVLAADAL